MNLVDAAKTGRPIKRPQYEFWFVHGKDDAGDSLRDQNGDRFIPYIDDLTADDWEVQEETRALTWAEIERAYFASQTNLVVKGTQKDLDFYRYNSQMGLLVFKKALGFL